MQIRVIDCGFDEETGNTYVQVRCELGDFIGHAYYNLEAEKFPPSNYVGIEIATARAYIAAYKYALNNLKQQLKGLKRLESSCGNNEIVFSYLNKTKKSILTDMNYYKTLIKECNGTIKTTKDARSLYIRSRSTDRKEKDKYLKQIQQGIKDLGQLSSKENK